MVERRERGVRRPSSSRSNSCSSDRSRSRRRTDVRTMDRSFPSSSSFFSLRHHRRPTKNEWNSRRRNRQWLKSNFFVARIHRRVKGFVLFLSLTPVGVSEKLLDRHLFFAQRTAFHVHSDPEANKRKLFFLLSLSLSFSLSRVRFGEEENRLLIFLFFFQRMINRKANVMEDVVC